MVLYKCIFFATKVPCKPEIKSHVKQKKGKHGVGSDLISPFENCLEDCLCRENHYKVSGTVFVCVVACIEMTSSVIRV